MNNIRRAVGAIIIQNEEFLLVQKIKVMDTKNNVAEQIDNGQWDFSKGGIKEGEDEITALLRELEEETGSKQYKVIKKFDEKISFIFPNNLKEKLGFDMQETTMFLVEYCGDRSDLLPKVEEISKVKFFGKDEILNTLFHEDTKGFFKKFF